MNTNHSLPALFLLILAAFAFAQATQPADPLDGAAVRVRTSEGENEYRLSRIAPPTSGPLQSNQPPPATAPAQISFHMLAGLRVAPATVHVHGLDIPLSNGTPLSARYDWDFGDPQGRFNTLTGFNASHVYDAPGKYTITLQLTDETGAIHTITREVTVAVDTRRSIYVATDGNDANDGADPSRPLRTLAAARKKLSDDTRLLLRRGNDFPITSTFTVPFSSVFIGAYGEGEQPRIVFSGPRKGGSILSADQATRDLHIENIVFDSIYNQDTEQSGIPVAIRPAGVNVAVRGCDFLNISNGLNCNLAPTGVTVMDCAAPLPKALRAYFVWGDGTDLVIVGNRVVNSTRESCVRVNGTAMQRALVAHNELSNPSHADDPDDTQKGAVVLQLGAYGYVAHNVIHSGSVAVGPLANREGQVAIDSRWRMSVFECNRIAGIGVNIEHGAEGVMLRNNVIQRDNGSSINIRAYSPELNRWVKDVSILNNTIVNTAERGRCINLEGKAMNITMCNNLYVAPDLRPGSHQVAAVYVADSDLSSFSGISHNIWPAPKNFTSFADGGVMYVWPTWSDKRGYFKPQAWQSLKPVSGDIFENVTVDNNFAPAPDSPGAAHGRIHPAARFDFNDKMRAGTNCAVGAIQP